MFKQVLFLMMLAGCTTSKVVSNTGLLGFAGENFSTAEGAGRFPRRGPAAQLADRRAPADRPVGPRRGISIIFLLLLIPRLKIQNLQQ